MTLEDFPELGWVIFPMKVVGILDSDKLPYGVHYPISYLLYLNLNLFWEYVYLFFHYFFFLLCVFLVCITFSIISF
jgi:hypothetical protein